MQVNIPERVIERAIQQQYFNKTESAAYLGISLTTFIKWRKNDALPFYSVNGQILYSKDDLNEYMKKHKHE
ncbi:helix-turn-helix domain-containing protein [Lactobacillus gasseri]|uniref:DNA-binding protein n=1 Tax=Lactobacillus gasseri TaxID=1596 RepID=A0AB33C4M8_LACGS|nr:helix-turn-helix domain-containing protein [Lactobacillus gasseri]ART99215.1 DNA-binding protein [Lactobacillus gasseri]RBQ00706.1 DNA-binding protein [Lactobacillus gasseri]